MKFSTLIFLMFLLLSCTGNKGRVKTPAAAGPVQPTRIEFDTWTYNLGHLNAGEIAVATFTFTNTGEHDFSIENAETDCGCITVHYSEEPVKPGGKGIIEVEFDSSGMVGREYKTIEIHGNSADLKHLAIFAEVKNELLDIKY